MQLSRTAHAGQARVGLIEKGQPPYVCQGIETIDASAVKGDVLGHTYIGEDSRVIQDLEWLIYRGERATTRARSRLSLLGVPDAKKPAWWSLRE